MVHCRKDMGCLQWVGVKLYPKLRRLLGCLCEVMHKELDPKANLPLTYGPNHQAVLFLPAGHVMLGGVHWWTKDWVEMHYKS